MILHICLEGFAAAALAPRGTASAAPVIVLDGERVRDASPPARRRGVRRGMPAWRARQLCPEAACREWDEGEAAVAAERWRALCHSLFPRVEPDGWEAVFLAPAPVTAEAARAPLYALAAKALPGLGDALRAGAAPAKAVARIAGRLAASGRPLSREAAGAATVEAPAPGVRLILVPPGREAAFLAPLPVRALKEEVPVSRLTALERLGCRRLGDLQRLPASLLSQRFGREAGERLAQLARGIDPRSVAAAYPPPEARVRLPLGGAPLSDDALDHCAHELARRLLAGRQVCATLALEVEPVGGAPCRRERPLVRPSLRPEALAAHLRTLAAGLAAAEREAVHAVSAVAARPAALGGWRQQSLWGEPGRDERADQAELAERAGAAADRARRLEAAVAAVRARFGQASLQAGAPPGAGDTCGAGHTWRERRLALWDPWRQLPWREHAEGPHPRRRDACPDFPAAR